MGDYRLETRNQAEALSISPSQRVFSDSNFELDKFTGLFVWKAERIRSGLDSYPIRVSSYGGTKAQILLEVANKMKIITWNCNMAFRKKASFILIHKPDILIIVECEHPEKLLYKVGTPKPTDCLWFGKNQHKGLAIFSYGDYRFRVLDNHNDEFKMIIPIGVTGGHFDFNLFLIWAYNPNDMDGRYITQVWKAINHYDELLTEKPTMLIGDFNSNTIWDHKKHRLGSHSAVVKQLEEKGIFSTYHIHHKQTQGTEQHPTFYMYRHKNKPYHIDYCFVSIDMLNKLQSVEVGDYEFWIKHSDHVPLIVTLDSAK